jgi:hypothetical protein
MFPVFIYPISYILIDTFLVVFIKATSIAGKTSYNTITANAITEFIKLCIAINIAKSEGSLHTLWPAVKNPGLLIRFLIPNLMYALNNNLFHYSVGALPPAVFVVAINAFRTVFTAVLQPCVSNQALTFRQTIACFILVLSFICASLPEVIKAAYNGTVKGSIFESLIYLSTIYSIISVGASLSQEKLLKDSKSLMVANIINYTIGLGFQLSGMAYEYYQNPAEADLFRGLDIFWIKLIPCFMAVVGLSISYVLKYYDNIVKLLCSSISVLLVNTVTAYIAGESVINVFFLVGWLLTLPATYLYYIQPNPPKKIKDKDESNLPTIRSSIEMTSKGANVDGEDDKAPLLSNDGSKNDIESSTAPSKGEDKTLNPNQSNGLSSHEKYGISGIVGFVFIYSIMTSKFEIGSSGKGSNAALGLSDTTCSIFEVPNSDSRSNMKTVTAYEAKYSTQFVKIDSVTGNTYVSCPATDSLLTLGPDTPETVAKVQNLKVRLCPIHLILLYLNFYLTPYS